jgi:hypothetical protein
MKAFRADNLKSKRTTAQAASLVPNGVTNATLTITAATAGGAGNSLSVRCVNGVGNDQALAAAISGGLITITLGTDSGGSPDDTKNTGTLVAAAVDALDEVTCTTSGTGAGIVATFAQQSLTNGHDKWSVTALAKQANVSDRIIQRLEAGGTCDVGIAARLATALGATTAALGSAL